MKLHFQILGAAPEWIDPIERIIDIGVPLHRLASGHSNGAFDMSTMLEITEVLLGVWALVGLLSEWMKRRRNGFGESAVLKRFGKVRSKSQCPFALKARTYAAGIDRGQALEDGAKSLALRLLDFTEVARKRKLDGFVIELPANRFATDLREFSESFNRVLREIAQLDPSENDCFKGPVTKKGWQFSFNGTRFFITTFAPFYDNNHPRYCPVKRSAFIFLQPEYSFDHHGISKKNSHREELKRKIRAAFEHAGSAYDVALVKQPIEALKYIKPMKLSAPPVRWWEMK